MKGPRPDNDAVSPVIGTILLVGITVILAGTLLVIVNGLVDLDDWESGESGFPDPGGEAVTSPLYRSPGLTTNEQEVYTGKDVNLTQGSLVTWIKLSSTSDWGGIIFKGEAISNSEFDQSYGMQMAGSNLDSGNVDWLGWCDTPNNDLSGSTGRHPMMIINMDGTEGNVVAYGARSPVQMQTGDWYMIAGSFRHDRIEFNIYSTTEHLGTSYVTPNDVLTTSKTGNGVAEAKATIADAGDSFIPRQTPDKPLIVLTQGFNSNYDLDGEIFDWRIYSTAIGEQGADRIWMDTRYSLP